jgi:hypothetical protein
MDMKEKQAKYTIHTEEDVLRKEIIMNGEIFRNT